MKPIVIITGYGPGLGEALKQRFEQGGYQAIGIARSAGDFQADLTDPEQTDAVIKAIIKQHGSPKVVIHNVAELIRGKFLDLEASDFERAWRSTVLTAINVSQAVIPSMLDQQAGTIIQSANQGRRVRDLNWLQLVNFVEVTLIIALCQQVL